MWLLGSQPCQNPTSLGCCKNEMRKHVECHIVSANSRPMVNVSFSYSEF